MSESILQEDLILNEIRSNPMISVLKSPNELLSFYENSDMPGFVPGVHYLAGKFLMRQVRGDGNCFYRALLYSYLELLLVGLENDVSEFAIQELTRMRSFINKSKDDLLALGYSEFTIESFYDMFVELLEGLPKMNRDTLLSMFQEDGSGDYYTWYMRVLCSCSLRKNSERFFPFIDDGQSVDMKAYCEREVEPMGKEVEQVQIIALAEYMGLNIHIHYLDGRLFDSSVGLPVIKLPELGLSSEVQTITTNLLYRPGHYDILYVQ